MASAGVGAGVVADRWSGTVGVRLVDRSMNGVVEGKMKLARQRGFCEIRGAVPNLWPWIVGSLGFEILGVRFGCDEGFTTLIHDRLGQHIKTFGGEVPIPPAKLDVVFSDYESLPPFSSASYWYTWRLPHMVYAPYKPFDAPPGWSWTGHYMSHRDYGGCSTSRWWVGVLHFAQDARFLSTPAPMTSPFRPFDGVLQFTPNVQPLPSMPPTVVAHPTVIRPVGSYLSPSGIFPCDDLHSDVLVKSPYSASGWGTRHLTLFELGAIWDVPISFLDTLDASHSARDSLSALLASCPGKLLFCGADSLLFRVPRGVGTDITISANSADVLSTSDVMPTIPEPVPLPPIRSPQCEDKAAVVPPPLDASSECPIPLQAISTLETVLRRNLLKEGVDGGVVDSLMLRMKQPIKEVGVKADNGQKSDDAGIPIELWDMHLILSWKTNPKLRSVEALENTSWRLALEAHRRFWITRLRRLQLFSFWRWVQLQNGSEFARTTNDIKEGVVQPVWTLFPDGKFGWKYRWGGSNGAGKAKYTLWWKKLHDKHKKNIVGARDCMRRSSQSDFWEWLGGSRPYFWLWPLRDVEMLRDGQPHFMTGSIKPFTKKQSKAKTPELHAQMSAKLLKSRLRDYIEVGFAESLMHFFAVAKGPLDIRLVFNGTSCGLNANIFAPHFGLPTVFQTLRSLDVGTFACDIDIGECFLNFMLHESLRKFSGADVSNCRSDDPALAEWEADRPNRWERWCRNWFGLTDSPYRCMQPLTRAKQIAYGDRKQEDNPFSWDRVELNLPGSENYDPSKGWVLKLRASGELACEVFIYIDDGRVTGATRELCWAAAQRFASVCNSLGIQSAGRKRTPPSPCPGHWAGNVVFTLPYVAGTLTLERWAKTRAKVMELVDAFKEGAAEMGLSPEVARPLLDSSMLQSNRGFLNYVGRTYKWLPPYLKGLHLTIDIWREFKDPLTGYSLKGKERARAESMGWHNYVLEQWELNGDGGDTDVYKVSSEDDPPPRVQAAERLWSDLKALEKLTSVEEPPIQRYRAEKLATVLYLLGDASGHGFGSINVDGDEVEWQTGACSDAWKEESSNFREANNITTRLEELAEQKKLHGVEIFLITDNMVFEGCFCKGHSSSEKLTDIILRLRVLERDHSLVLHVIHISGKRMKASGVDGLSRGDNSEGIMAGENPLKYIPLNLGANERSQGRVETWVRSWWSDHRSEVILKKPLKLLEPEDWFNLHEIEEARLWMPPPAAMETVLSLFNEDRLTRPDIPHVFCVPRLMTHLWRKALSKDADVLFEVDVGNDIWTDSQFEPLVVAIVFPLAHVDRYLGPWLVRGTDIADNAAKELTSGFKCARKRGKRQFDDMDGELQAVWKNPEERSRDILRKFLHRARKLPPVQKCLVWPMLSRVSPRPVPQDAAGGGGGRRESRKRNSREDAAVRKRKKRRSSDGHPL